MKQIEMAKALGVEPDTYSKYEREGSGRRGIPPHLMERFCIVAGVTLEYLIAGRPRSAGRKPLSGGSSNLAKERQVERDRLGSRRF